MITPPYGKFICITLLLLVSSFQSNPTIADVLPPDQEAAELQASLAEEPGDALGWIRLADLQRLMGYGHQARASFAEAAAIIKELPEEEKREMAGPYYTAKAWLEYDTTNWDDALAYARMAYELDPCSETRLVSILSRYAAQGEGKIGDDPVRGKRGDPKPADFRPRSETGPSNNRRNFYWTVLMFRHFHREAWDYNSWSHTGGFVPNYKWKELFCRRDHGYVFESIGLWARAGDFYRFSVERSPLSRGNWARVHERRTPQQETTDPPMPFWTNADGGYVTGSLMAYTDFACESMLSAGSPAERENWAALMGDGAARSLAVYSNQPWPWLWRALAWQAQGELKRADSDLAQAEAEFMAMGKDDPLLAFAQGHQQVLRGKFAAAIPHLEKSIESDRGNPRCWSDLGLARIQTDDRDGALAAYNEALALSPDLVAALHNRGMLHLQDGRANEAVQDLATAAELAPHDQQIVSDLQRAQMARKE